jgi:NADH-quinone oxidoreductase E subunit
MARVLSSETLEAIQALFKRYPTRLAALLPSLHLVQKQCGHISQEAELDVAEALDVPPTRVREVVTFYTMYHSKPVGKHVVKICRNLSCKLRGADKIIAHAKKVLGVELGETTADGCITLDQDECLASCGTGPMLWCDDAVVENLTEEKLEAFLAGLRSRDA